MNHLKTWFSTKEECPSGCGCKCLSLLDNGLTSGGDKSATMETILISKEW